jgi:hypothetical protein
MFKKFDNDCEDMVADPIRRRAKIALITKRRPFIFCCVMLVFVCAAVTMFEGGKAGIGGVFGAAICWGIYLYQEIYLYLLKVIDLLQKDKDGKPTA